MKKVAAAILLILIASLNIDVATSTGAVQEAPVRKLIRALRGSFEVVQVNGSPDEDAFGFDLLYSEQSPEESSIPDPDTILNGISWKLVACSGNILDGGKKGFAVGTAVEGPTFGHILIFDEKFKRVAVIDCQKIVRMKLMDLLDNGAKEIVTWEDHHYGTNTTRRTLVIYKVFGGNVLKKVFEHDLVDQRHVFKENEGEQGDLDYSIDLETVRTEKAILVSPHNGDATIYRWNGKTYSK